jgi:hypothetical protein
MHEAGKSELLNLAGGFPAKRTLLVIAIPRCQKTSHPNLNHETHERPRKARNAFVAFVFGCSMITGDRWWTAGPPNADVSFEIRPGEVGVGNGLRPTLCRSSESHLCQTHGGFFVAKLAEMWYS